MISLSREKTSLAATNILRFYAIFGASTVMQLYAQHLGANPFQISLIDAVWGAGVLLFAPLWGTISDLTGHRKNLILLSIIFTALLTPIYGYITAIYLLILIRFLISALTDGYSPIALALASSYGGMEDRGKNMAVFNSSRSVGLIAGRISAGLMIAYLAYTQSFLLLGLAGLLALLPASLLKKDTLEQQKHRARDIAKLSFKRIIPSSKDNDIKKNGLPHLLTGIFLRRAGVVGIYSLIAVYMVAVKNVPAGLMGLLLALDPILQSVFMLIFGRLVDINGRKNIFSLGFLLTTPVPVIFALANHPLTFAAGFILLGFSFSAVAAGATAFIGDIAPAHRQAEFLGFRKTSHGIAAIVGALSAGTIATLFGYQNMLYAMAVIIGLGFLFAHLGTTETLRQ